MNIFSILPDVTNYKQLHYGDEQLETRFEELMLRGEPKLDTWEKPFAEWIEERPSGSMSKKPYKIPDIACIGIDLVLNPKAIKILKPLFISEAEFLPISIDGEEWALLNVTTLQDIFDKANSQYKIRTNGKIGRLLKMAVDKSKLTNGKLFKIIGKLPGLYTDDAPNSFKAIIEQNKLTGIDFVEI